LSGSYPRLPREFFQQVEEAFAGRLIMLPKT
jgi:hypothetical protein